MEEAAKSKPDASPVRGVAAGTMAPSRSARRRGRRDDGLRADFGQQLGTQILGDVIAIAAKKTSRDASSRWRVEGPLRERHGEPRPALEIGRVGTLDFLTSRATVENVFAKRLIGT